MVLCHGNSWNVFLALKVAVGWQASRRSSNSALANLRGKRTIPAPSFLEVGPISGNLFRSRRRVHVNSGLELVMSVRKKSQSRAARNEKKQSLSKAKSASAIHLVSKDVAQIQPDNQWIDLNVPASELRPSATLTNGQCFNWIAVDSSSNANHGDSSSQQVKDSAWGVHDAVEWIGPLDTWVLSIRETSTSTWYRVLAGPNDERILKERLRSYFQLETPLQPLYERWSMQDPRRMKRIAEALPGVRVLRQDPIECLFSFICSSNNNIPRIKLILGRFRQAYGIPLVDVPVISSGTDSKIRLHAFPTLEALEAATESDLRDLGLGYRAKYMIQTRDLLLSIGGKDYLLDLRGKDADFIRQQLVKFHGVGPKVADCVALFSLDASTAIPVDVHVQQIACRDYGCSELGEMKSLTPAIYKRVGDAFRKRFGSYAGWAHSLLFAAELPSFRPVLPLDLIEEMNTWREMEQKRRLEKKLKGKESAASRQGVTPKTV